MNFVRDDSDLIAKADFSHADQFLFCPDSPHWIVRIAKNKKPYLIYLDFRLKIFEIDLVFSVSINQRIVHKLSVIGQNHICKGVVYWALDQYAVTGFCESSDRGTDCEDDTGCLYQPALFCLPAEVFLIPVMNRFKIRSLDL